MNQAMALRLSDVSDVVGTATTQHIPNTTCSSNYERLIRAIADDGIVARARDLYIYVADCVRSCIGRSQPRDGEYEQMRSKFNGFSYYSSLAEYALIEIGKDARRDEISGAIRFSGGYYPKGLIAALREIGSYMLANRDSIREAVMRWLRTAPAKQLRINTTGVGIVERIKTPAS